MNRKIIIVLISLLFIITGCSKKNDNENIKYFKLIDKTYGTLSFKYDSKLDLISEETTKENSNSVEYNISSKSLNFIANLYYFETSDWQSDKEYYKNKNEYKEYKFNNYEAFIFSETNTKLEMQLHILLNKTDDKSIKLIANIKRMDENQENELKNIINNDDINKILNSIKYVK